MSSPEVVEPPADGREVSAASPVPDRCEGPELGRRAPDGPVERTRGGTR